MAPAELEPRRAVSSFIIHKAFDAFEHQHYLQRNFDVAGLILATRPAMQQVLT
jgi:hypothetical protein